MNYIIRIFLYNDETGEERYHESYVFQNLPYIPRIGESIAVGPEVYLVTDIISSFDLTPDRNHLIYITVAKN